MIRFEVLQALKGRIFTGYITKEDGTVRNIWGQFSDKYTNQKAKQVDLENDQIRVFDYTIEDDKPKGFRIFKPNNNFSIKSGNTTVENKDGRLTVDHHHDWRSI